LIGRGAEIWIFGATPRSSKSKKALPITYIDVYCFHHPIWTFVRAEQFWLNLDLIYLKNLKKSSPPILTVLIYI